MKNKGKKYLSSLNTNCIKQKGVETKYYLILNTYQEFC